MTPQNPATRPDPKGFSVKETLLILALAMLVTMVVTALTIKILLFPGPLTPVVLNQVEEQRLETKLEMLSLNQTPPPKGAKALEPAQGLEQLQPEPYSESDLTREIIFSQRELNALLARNTDLAQKMAIHLGEDAISLKIRIPLDPDLPLVGGQTFRARAGVELAFREGRPVVKLEGITLMGVAMPGSWLGGLKNVDLVNEFGKEPGFWQGFAEGVESLRVTDGYLKISLHP